MINIHISIIFREMIGLAIKFPNRVIGQAKENNIDNNTVGKSIDDVVGSLIQINNATRLHSTIPQIYEIINIFIIFILITQKSAVLPQAKSAGLPC